MRPVFISVVRDFRMYSSCIGDNPYCADGSFVTFDNRSDNVPVPVRYNTFLNSLPENENSWLVFCHEDWQPLQNVSALLSNLDREKIYGPIGVFVSSGIFRDFVQLRGRVLECAKDGSDERDIRGASGRVDTLDCQCLMVHSDLVRKFGLRFDESLSFDMYAEEFCVDAYLSAGIITRTLDIKCRHYSRGTISDSFAVSLAHAREKYRGSKKRFATIVGYKTVFGGDESRPVLRYRKLQLRLL